jgi:hypothetical protein
MFSGGFSGGIGGFLSIWNGAILRKHTFTVKTPDMFLQKECR